MLLKLTLALLLVVATTGLYYSLIEMIHLERERIIRKSQLLGFKTFALGVLYSLKYPRWHPMHWVGKLLMKLNDLQQTFHTYLLTKLSNHE